MCTWWADQVGITCKMNDRRISSFVRDQITFCALSKYACVCVHDFTEFHRDYLKISDEFWRLITRREPSKPIKTLMCIEYIEFKSHWATAPCVHQTDRESRGVERDIDPIEENIWKNRRFCPGPGLRRSRRLARANLGWGRRLGENLNWTSKRKFNKYPYN